MIIRKPATTPTNQLWRKLPDVEDSSDQEDVGANQIVKVDNDGEVFETDQPEIDFGELNDQEADTINPLKDYPQE